MTKHKPIRSKQFNGLCPECGQAYINIFGSLYASCPNAHGKLIERLTAGEKRRALALLRNRELKVKYPLATLVEGTRRFTLAGKEGLFRRLKFKEDGCLEAIVLNKSGNFVVCFFRPLAEKAKRTRKPKKDVQPV